jgi:NDP-sugar pyrophosphorylase family protein
MARIRNAIIMAAGRGLRMMPLTATVPKAMAPFLDSTLIANVIRRIRKHVDVIHVTVGYKGPLLAEHVISLGADCVYNTSGKGNSWWIYNTMLMRLDEPLLVLTCDNVVELDLEQLEREYMRQNEPTCMLVPVKPVPGMEGDYIFRKDDLVMRLDRNTQSDMYCSGIQVLNPAMINRLTSPVEDFYSVWEQLITQRQVYCSRIIPKRWFSVDTVDQLSSINESESALSSTPRRGL